MEGSPEGGDFVEELETGRCTFGAEATEAEKEKPVTASDSQFISSLSASLQFVGALNAFTELQ